MFLVFFHTFIPTLCLLLLVIISVISFISLKKKQLKNVFFGKKKQNTVVKSQPFLPKPSLLNRPLCAVESIASQMTNSCVRFLVVDLQENDPRNRIAHELRMTKHNIRITKFNPIKLLHDTPLRGFTGEKTREIKFYYPELSDAVRFALIYKYGGTYMDSDMVAVRPLPKSANFFTRVVKGGGITSAIIKASKPFEPVALLLFIIQH